MEHLKNAMRTFIEKQVACSVEEYRFLEHLNHAASSEYAQMTGEVSQFHEQVQQIQSKCMFIPLF